MKDSEDKSFAANSLGVFLLMLRERYSDAEIKKMLSPNKIKRALKILDGEDS